jgi:DNA polymerase-1
MERRGIQVDAKDYLASVEVQARKDREEHKHKFREWAKSKIGPDGLAMNPASSTQLGTFIFGGSQNFKTKEVTETRRVFKVVREEIPDDAMEAYKRDAEERNSKEGGKFLCRSISCQSL